MRYRPIDRSCASLIAETLFSDGQPRKKHFIQRKLALVRAHKQYSRNREPYKADDMDKFGGVPRKSCYVIGLDPVKFIEIQTWRKLSPPMRFLIRTNFFFQKFQTRKVLNCWRYFSLNVFHYQTN
uniref:Uncharacterized protein n=1 Tax=Magallana gigas TaxID=29159 RepID=K1R4J4_MAGGI